MSEVLLAQSYYLRYDPKEYKAMMPYAPLATLYAASYLRQHGYSPTLFDSMLSAGEHEFLAALENQRPMIVAIYDDNFNYLTKMCLERMRRAALLMAKKAKARGSTVIVWSCDATDNLEIYFDQGVDYAIIGEGEQTLLELADALTGRSAVRPEDVPGIAFRTPAGAIVKTRSRSPIRDLDSLPFPAWDLIDVEKYRRAWMSRHGFFSMNMITTRGCPFHCNWCAKPIYGQVYHARSPENVAFEMQWLKALYHPDHLWFCDDIFGLKPGWTGRFATAVKNSGAVIPFKCLARVDLLLKENVITWLREAGCEKVWVGAESGSQKVLDAMDKGTTVEQIHEATRRLHANGIRVGFFLQFGYPVETKSDILETIRMVRECIPDEIGISVSYPLPGTKFFESVREKLGEKKNWVDSQDLALLFPGRFVPDYYRVLHKVVHKELRLVQAWMDLKELVRRPRHFTREMLRRIFLTPYYVLALIYHRIFLKRLERIENKRDEKLALQMSHIVALD
jgi:anaerobic magnesium-protoporphyrin IX monomethyl ester cyclase